MRIADFGVRNGEGRDKGAASSRARGVFYQLLAPPLEGGGLAFGLPPP